ncbi:hypothetical protein BMS3Abin15_01130 [bacterium BMS3Abin15]|nr:hypothetical protein BMS3Abin15_01130 [bacterium BMS3Abin15]
MKGGERMADKEKRDKGLSDEQITRRMVKWIIMNEGASNLKPNDVKRRMGNIARDINAPTDDVIRAVKPILEEVFKEVIAGM